MQIVSTMIFSVLLSAASGSIVGLIQTGEPIIYPDGTGGAVIIDLEGNVLTMTADAQIIPP
jgi:hypothetical protein